MSIFETIIIAIVEGLTEFLPVSSTGHMIIAQNLLGGRKYRICEGIYLYHPIRCHPFGRCALLETILPTEPHSSSRRCQWITTLLA